MPKEAESGKTLRRHAADFAECILVVGVAVTVPYCMWQLLCWWRRHRREQGSRCDLDMHKVLATDMLSSRPMHTQACADTCLQ